MATILCIDDNANILELQKALLERNGYTVLSAIDGTTGVALTRKHALDAIVLDFNMPGMDGNEVAAIIAKEQPRLPVIVCSGHSDQIPESLRWFADALIEKATGPETLLSAVARLIDRGTAPKGMSTRGRLRPQPLVA